MGTVHQVPECCIRHSLENGAAELGRFYPNLKIRHDVFILNFKSIGSRRRVNIREADLEKQIVILLCIIQKPVTLYGRITIKVI